MDDPLIVRITESDGIDQYLIDEIRVDARARLSEVPARFADATVTVPAVAEWVRELVAGAVKDRQDRGMGDPEIRRGRSLALIGPVGTGKTHQAWGAIRAITESGVRCNWRFEKATRMLMGLEPRPDFSRELAIQAVESAGLLVLDDLGSAKGSATSEQVILRIVDHRYDHELPTIVTTNLGGGHGDSLSSVLGDRVGSRLEQMCTAVVMAGKDRRRTGRT